MIYARPHLLLWLIQPTCKKLVVGGRPQIYHYVAYSDGRLYIFFIFRGPKGAARARQENNGDQNGGAKPPVV